MTNSQVTMAEIVADESPPAPGRATKPLATKGHKTTPSSLRSHSIRAKKSGRLSDKKIKVCLSLLERFQRPYTRLMHNSKATAGPIARLSSAAPDDCRHFDKRKALVKGVLELVDQHSGKIAALLPLSGSRSFVANSVAEGLRAALPNDLLIVHDNRGDPALTDKLLTQLIERDKVSMIIGGLEPRVAKRLALWGESLMLPMILLSNDSKIATNRKHVFRAYPDERYQGESLAKLAQSRGHQSVAILKPTTKKSDRLLATFKEKGKHLDLAIVHEISYTPRNFESMDRAIRQMCQLDQSARRAEFQEMYWRAKQRAKRLGVPFDRRSVVLPPIVNFDTVLIPGDFKTVRYFAKLLRFHGVKQIPLLGNHEWRSPALIQPFDEFLTGSAFADFVGSYNQLPKGLQVPISSSPFFVSPKNVAKTDFRMIGYRVGQIVNRTKAIGAANRRRVSSALRNVQRPDGGPAFDQTGSAIWPIHMFQIANGRLQQLSQDFIPRSGDKRQHRNARPVATPKKHALRWRTSRRTR